MIDVSNANKLPTDTVLFPCPFPGCHWISSGRRAKELWVKLKVKSSGSFGSLWCDARE
jgi:hypothetical protein